MIKKIIITAFAAICCLAVACATSTYKKIEMDDGIKLKMCSYHPDMLVFSSDSDELVILPDTNKERHILYLIIDNETAEEHMGNVAFANTDNKEKGYSTFVDDGEKNFFYYCAPFISQENVDSKNEPQYWLWVEVAVEDVESFKYDLHIIEGDSLNLLNTSLEFYVVE